MKKTLLITMLCLLFAIPTMAMFVKTNSYVEPSPSIRQLIGLLESNPDESPKPEAFIELMVKGRLLTPEIFNEYFDLTAEENLPTNELFSRLERTNLVLKLIEVAKCNSEIRSFLNNTKFFEYEDVRMWQNLKKDFKHQKEDFDLSESQSDVVYVENCIIL